MRGKGYLRDSIPENRRTPFHRLAARLGLGATLPDAFSLADRCPAIFDQGPTGACTGHATARAIAGRLWKSIDFVPSPKGLYQVGIALDRLDVSTPLLDVGAEPSQVMRGCSEEGIRAMGPQAADGRFSDADWVVPEDGSDPVVPEITQAEIEADARAVLTKPYAILGTGQARRDQIRQAIAAGVLVCIAVDASDGSPLQNYTSGVLSSLGLNLDHYVVIDAYATESGVEGGVVYEVPNSWGDSWGESGKFRIAGSAIDQLGDLYAVDVALLGGAS